MSQILTIIGLMSGTSLDGIDAAIIKTDGTRVFDFGPSLYLEYETEFRKKLKNLINDSCHISSIEDLNYINNLNYIENEITYKHAEIVNKLLISNNINKKDIDLIGFHGQTIMHNPAENLTFQIGNGKILASLTGINVIYKFRQNDIENKGQGAPLVPIYHKAITHNMKKPIAILNIGGVSNVTYIDDNNMIAFDTGPGCALIDDYIYKNLGLKYDINGNIARTGKINYKDIDIMMKNEFFETKPPKSLDRNQFSLYEINEDKHENVISTLTYFTACSIENSLKYFPSKPNKWIITGGGRKNKYLIELLYSLINTEIILIDQIADGDMIEAQAFAYLAARSVNNMPITFPLTTGVCRPLTGGVFCPV